MAGRVASTARQWTRRVIMNVEPMVNRRFGCEKFHLTQILSGHDRFSQYLYRFKKLDNSGCVDCNAQIDDAEHAFFSCDRLWRERRSFEVHIGTDLSPDTVIGLMLQ